MWRKEQIEKMGKEQLTNLMKSFTPTWTGGIDLCKCGPLSSVSPCPSLTCATNTVTLIYETPQSCSILSSCE